MRLPTYQQLTKEQDRINNLPLNGTWLVTGPPGTGKTVMALYRSKMISDQQQATTLLMYNRLLSQYISQAVGELGIEGVAHTFFSWWMSFCREHWGEYPKPDGAPTTDFNPDWRRLAELYAENGLPADALPYLLVDEGQDLPKYFYAFANTLATHLTVFADENQVLQDEHSTLAAIRYALDLDGEYELRQNYRNSQPIAAVAAHFYPEGRTGVPDPPTRPGLPVQVRRHRDITAAAAQIANLATTNADQQIGVLVQRIDHALEYVAALRERGVAAQWYTSRSSGPGPEIDFSAPGVFVTTWKSAKGLEFDTVFIAELQTVWVDPSTPGVRMQLYVLASRARDRLVFTYTGPIEPEIVKRLPSDVERVP